MLTKNKIFFALIEFHQFKSKKGINKEINKNNS